MRDFKKPRIGIIFGGRSGEHEVSIASALSIIGAIDESKYEVVPIGIAKDGRWLSPAQSKRMLAEGKGEPTQERGQGMAAILRHALAIAYKVDVAFPIVHGTYGEDGTLQGLLEMADIPYVGAGVLASAIGMDKVAMKTTFRQHDLPVADSNAFTRRQWQSSQVEIIHRVEQQLGYPCFVKPSNSGSSLGISKAHSREELIDAIDSAARFDRRILVEKAINAREVECSVLGNDEPIASTVGEIIPGNEFYDYEAKYSNKQTRLIVPALLPAEVEKEIRQLAIQAFLAIDCAGMARVDFFLGKEDGRIYINEINTVPGFTEVSMYPKLWQASGLSYTELIDRLIQLALERHEDKSKAVHCQP